MSKAIAVSEKIEGNIGDCKVNHESYNVSLFTREVVATNSCTGEVVASNQMFDAGWLWFGVAVVLLFLIIIQWLFSY